MVMVLMVITLIAAAAVGIVFELTKDPIEAGRILRVANALKEVLPEFDKISDGERVSKDGGEMVLYSAEKNGELVAYAVESFSKGYAGEIRILVGFLKDGTINKTAVISHKETPGLGDKIDRSKSNFPIQFDGKNPGNFKLGLTKDGTGDVDAITASTITSKAFIEAVKRAYSLVKEQN